METITLHKAKFIFLGAKGKANIIEYRDYYKRLFDAYIEKLQPLNEIQKANSIDISIQTEQEYLSLIPSDKTLLRGLHEANIIQLNELKTQSTAKPFDGLLLELNAEQLDKLFKFLTDENKAFSKSIFIDIKTTDRQSFDYIFGGKEKPIQFKPIEWQANNQWLREILAGLQIIKNYHKDTNTLQLSNEIERQTADYFIKKGKAINIKSTKQLKDKPEYKAITKFLATI